MPIYEYLCEDGHVTERRGDLDEDTITCLHMTKLPVVAESGAAVAQAHYCNKSARRRPAYASQGVIFPGVGFTRTVIPPKPPDPKTEAGEPTPDWFEKLDEYAEKQHKDDVNYRDERKKQAKKMLEQVDRGALP